MSSNIMKRAAAVVTSVALAAGIATVTATSADAAKKAPKSTVKVSKTEPTIPAQLCSNGRTGKPVDCATGRALTKAQARYADQQSDYYAGQSVNGGAPVWVINTARVNSTQHIPVPKSFVGKDVTVTAELSSTTYGGCGWLMMLTGAAAQGEKVTMDKGEATLTVTGDTRIRGNALTVNLPNIRGGNVTNFIDLTLTRTDGKQHRITVVWSLKSVKSTSDTLTFGS